MCKEGKKDFHDASIQRQPLLTFLLFPASFFQCQFSGDSALLPPVPYTIPCHFLLLLFCLITSQTLFCFLVFSVNKAQMAS